LRIIIILTDQRSALTNREVSDIIVQKPDTTTTLKLVK